MNSNSLKGLLENVMITISNINAVSESLTLKTMDKAYQTMVNMNCNYLGSMYQTSTPTGRSIK